ncbi:MAG: sensor histidine kinase [Bacteroidota bacterium]
MSPFVIILCAVGYMCLLFWVAWYTERSAGKGRNFVNNPYIYSLSLAVYCTAWTFFGSVGKAVESGIDFLPIYLGPTIMAPMLWFVLRKMILISKSQRITSIADFISSRYGKSTYLGALATLLALLAILPYISIQLKGAAVGYEILRQSSGAMVGDHVIQNIPFYLDSAFYIAIALAVFTILFGTRHLDPNERHEGLVAAVAFESLLKLIAFLAAGVFVTFFLFDGFGDLFRQASQHVSTQNMFSLENNGTNGTDWFWMILISMMAVILLPRQFHLAVVENTDSNFVRQASWVFPLYLLLINIFVIPIAIGGLLLLNESASPDFYVLDLPITSGNYLLTLLVAIGGFSAATSMVIVAVIALSIMISNNLVVPTLLRSNTITGDFADDLQPRLIGIRRVSIIVVFFLAYGYFKFVSSQFTIVSIGLISFVGISQFAPAVLGGMFWKRATRKGAIYGLTAGLLIWTYCLPLTTLADAGVISSSFYEHGLLGIELLKPHSLFGMKGMSPISHGAFWSLTVNIALFVIVSLNNTPSTIEITQADLFVDIYKYETAGSRLGVNRRAAQLSDIKDLLFRFLGDERAKEVLQQYQSQHQVNISQIETANEDLITLVETALAGAIGSASSKVLLHTVVKEDPISIEEIFEILDQTQEILLYSKKLEQKSNELELTTQQLRQANKQLKELDQLKADFITTITHELRTPITSIKALAKILADNHDIPLPQKSEYLGIIVSESERISRLVNQVLEMEKAQRTSVQKDFINLDFNVLVNKAYQNLRPLMSSSNIEHQIERPPFAILVKGVPDQLTQVVVNLLSNAIKFCDAEKGTIRVSLFVPGNEAVLKVSDNGIGISHKDKVKIFEKFMQVNTATKGKPQGTGLGLAISRRIIEQHGGRIEVESAINQGATFIVYLPIIEIHTKEVKKYKGF